MKESYWGYWLILLGIFVIVVMMLIQNASTTNTQDYYQLKEVANSALYDSVDYAYYAQTGQVRIMKEIFVANFLKRFASTISLTDTYNIDFYDLYESPPKVSVKITTQSGNFVVNGDNASVDVVNSIDIIAEMPYDKTYPNDDDTPGGGPGGDTMDIVDRSCSYYLNS